MAGENVPGRLTAEFANIKLGLAAITAYVYTPISNFDTLPLFGPARDLEIDDPAKAVDLTAGGDQGEMEKFVRRGKWTIRCTALLDIVAVSGDARYRTLQQKQVEFLISNTAGFFICKGIGNLKGKLTLPAGEGGPILREIEITRWLPGTLGDIVYADLATGTF